MTWRLCVAVVAMTIACDAPRKEMPQRKDTRYCKHERVVPCDAATTVTCLECVEWGAR